MQVEQDYDPLEMEYSEKHMALAKFLEEDPDDITEDSDTRFSVGRREYIVLTDEEADEEAAIYIKDTLWAFNVDFLVHYVPDGVDQELLSLVQERCENGNNAMLGLVGSHLDELVEDAIRYDGRGHFLNHYDGNEDEQDNFYIYRQN